MDRLGWRGAPIPLCNPASESFSARSPFSIVGICSQGNTYLWLGGAGVLAIAYLWILHTHASLGDSSELLDKISFGSMWRERERWTTTSTSSYPQALAGWGITPLEVYRWTSVLAGGLVSSRNRTCGVPAGAARSQVAGGRLGLATGKLATFRRLRRELHVPCALPCVVPARVSSVRS